MTPSGGVSLLILLGVLQLCQGHGRLRCPPGRSVLWRDGLRAPQNYQDNELNCGGRSHQWDKNGGNCGVCGDPYDAEIQENQPPNGRYAKPSILTECYDSTTTEYIKTFIEITANHQGYIEFRLCPNNDFKKPVTQECLDRNVLQLRDARGKDHGTRFKLARSIRKVYLQMKIPAGIRCEQCVIQWRYVAANSWGCTRYSRYRGRCGIGHGPQESFQNCADVAILPDCSKVKVSRPGYRSVCRKDPFFAKRRENTNDAGTANKGQEKVVEKPSPNTGTPSGSRVEEKKSKETSNSNKEKDTSKTDSSIPSTSSRKTNSGNTKSDSKPTQKPTVKPRVPKTTTKKPKPDESKSRVPSRPTNQRRTLSCHAVGIWSNIRSMHYWCRINCMGGNCPKDMCVCNT